LKNIILGTFIAVSIGIISGSYPALFLSNLKPGQVLKDNAPSTIGSKKLRQFLVLGQFTISLILIICTIISWLQIKYMQLSWFSGIWSFGLCLLVSTPNTEVHILHTSNNGFSRHKGVYRPVCFATFFMLGEDSFPKHVSPFR